MRRRVLIMGAAGRDFHDFNVTYRDDPESEVVAFTATQIPFIANRTYPPELAGPPKIVILELPNSLRVEFRRQDIEVGLNTFAE